MVHVSCGHTHKLNVRLSNLLEGSGGCREAALSGDAHGAGDHRPEGQTDHSRGEGERTGGFQGQEFPPV